MAPKKIKRAGSSAVIRQRPTIELKKEIIAKYERGMRVSDIAREYGKSKSTISTILKKKEQLKEANVSKGVSIITKQRPQIIDEVEKLLLVYINEKQLEGASISEAFISEKALQIYEDLKKKTPETSALSDFVFKASRGWFEKFKHRTGIHRVIRHGEAASSDKAGAEKFILEFKKIIEEESYVPQQVFNADETGLFWKKMPNKTYITKEEKALSGHKPMKDRLTLLLCSNASGDFKLKPLLVYHSDNPRVFKKHNVIKQKLPVMWRSNSKAWVTRQFFVEWVTEVFAPAVKEYLEKNNLPLKCLLLLDNAPAHPPNIDEYLEEEFDFIQVRYLPPNTTPLLQPMDQQIISNFKKLYTKALFRKCFDITNDTNLTLKEFWKNHFNILNCVHLIDNAWNQVTYHTMNAGWRKLWPNCVPERDFEGFEPEIVDEIVSLGQNMGLEVDNNDVEELVEEHSNELTTEELQHLQAEQEKNLAEDMSSEGEEEGKEEVPSSVIKEMCAKWGELQLFVEKSFPNSAVGSRSLNMFNDNVMSYYRKVLQKRQKQQTLDKFFSSTSKRQRTSSDVLMEGDSPSKQ
ncbi:tigger transposable element-derived protein 1-like [Erpetoichthys calabaricus]|uniref:tigger transposable element-derived protein 1-like n=1 Tax=Erpetoichthys calabaricus TaxID=27687 RepID=UPI00109F56B6|nr:tigger transposable element-derived protein 1-like [Erpetoichthys calabaricus]